MKGVTSQCVLALVLAVVGVVLTRAGQVEQRVADAENELAMLQYTAPVEVYDEIEQSVRVANRLPWIEQLMGDVRADRATGNYWLADYDALTKTDATAAGAPVDPALSLVAANAAYRTTNLADANRQAVVRRLETVLAEYAEVLKQNPENVDAAYNYEFVARLRDQTAAARSGGKVPPGKAAPVVSPGAVLGRTLHGHPGAPPAEADMSQFKTLMPKTGEERTENPKAGKGNVKVRKG